MRKIWLIFTMLLVAKGLAAQTDIKALEASLKGKQEALRSYSADPVARYAWVAGGLQQSPVKVHTLGVFILDKIKEEDDSDGIVLLGKRATLTRDGSKDNKLEIAVKVPMSIQIELAGANRAEVLPQLETLLFFSSLQQAIDSLPKETKNEPSLPYIVGGKPEQAACNCIPIVMDGQRQEIPYPEASKIIPPKVVSEPEAWVTNEMREAGVVTVKMNFKYYVSDKGKIEDIWLARSGGYGMDDAEEKNFEHWVVKPATYNGHPVGTWHSAEMTITNNATSRDY